MRAFGRILRTPLGIAAVTLMALVVLTAIFAPIIWGTQADVVDTDNLLAPPSAEHPIGTDHLGRDLLLRVLVATRLSLVLATARDDRQRHRRAWSSAWRPTLLGRPGKAVTWFVGIAVAFPGLLLALFFAIIFGAGWLGAVLAIGLAGAPSFARLCQTLVAGVTERDYVAAARIGGVGRFRILTRHIFPNIGEPLIVNATIGAGGALLAFAGLSFIGIGVQPPEYDWGRLMMEGLPRIYINPLAAIAPGIAVVIAGLAFNLVGEAAARALGIESSGVSGKLKKRRPAPMPAASAVPSADDVVLDVVNLHVTFPGAENPVRSGARSEPSRSTAARPSASSANPARASPSRRCRSPSSCRSRATSSPIVCASSARTSSAPTRSDSAGCSARRWRWCSRTR